MPNEVRLIRTATERDACYLVRMAVFVDEQRVPSWEEMDEYDEAADHFAAIVDGSIVGTARLVTKGNGIGKIGRVAVVKDHRGKGLGRALVEAIISTRGGEVSEFTLDSQLYVIPFYESLGFTAEGEVFLDAGIEHRRMHRRIQTHGDNK